MRRFKTSNGDAWSWGQRRLGRLQLSLIIYRHKSSHLPDRWVVQPSVIYDRKKR